MTQIVVGDLTQSTLDGQGVFDVLMKATKAHLDSEFTKGRIKGTEYATVYLGSLESVMRTSIDFLLQRQKVAADVALTEVQVLLAEKGVIKEQASIDLINQQILNLISEELSIKARTALTNQQALNAITEGEVLLAQKCKLQAEYDNLLAQNLRVAAETALLSQKNLTEKAQTLAIGIDADSVIGKQKALYQAQTDGFKRDSEQKAANLLVTSWNARRMTDEATIADNVNMLSDVVVGRAITKMLEGVGA